MARPRVIVVGAGLGGLSAGLYALAQGFDCTIVERHTAAGGVAASWRRGEYVVDGGIYYLIGCNKGVRAADLYRELGLLPGLPLVEPSVLIRFLDERTDRAIDLSRNSERFLLELTQLAPGDKEQINRTLRLLPPARILDFSLLDKPPELMSWKDKTRQTWRMREELRFFSGQFIRPTSAAAGTMTHPFLKSLVSHMCLPEAPLWLTLALLSAFTAGQVALLKEGCVSLVGHLAEQFEDRGGELRLGCGVAQISTRPSGAALEVDGVLLETGERMAADYVVSAADRQATLSVLLEGRWKDAPADPRLQAWRRYRPLVMVSLGVARRFPTDAPVNVIFLRRPFFVGEDTVDMLRLRVFNYAPSFSAPGKTVVQAAFDSSWPYWSSLRDRDRAEYEAEKDRVAHEVIRRLELHYPGIAGQVELVDVATPYTTWRYTQNLEGSYAGWLPTPEVLASAVPRSLPGVRRLFLAGHWSVPGGGVAASLISGKHAVQLVCAAEGVPFRPIVQG